MTLRDITTENPRTTSRQHSETVYYIQAVEISKGFPNIFANPKNVSESVGSMAAILR